MHCYAVEDSGASLPKADGGRGQGPTVLLVWAYIPLRISAVASCLRPKRRPLSRPVPLSNSFLFPFFKNSLDRLSARIWIAQLQLWGLAALFTSYQIYYMFID